MNLDDSDPEQLPPPLKVSIFDGYIDRKIDWLIG